MDKFTQIEKEFIFECMIYFLERGLGVRVREMRLRYMDIGALDENDVIRSQNLLEKYKDNEAILEEVGYGTGV